MYSTKSQQDNTNFKDNKNKKEVMTSGSFPSHFNLNFTKNDIIDMNFESTPYNTNLILNKKFSEQNNINMENENLDLP